MARIAGKRLDYLKMPNLKLDSRNARKHSERNKRVIRQSLKEVGAGRGVLADANGIIRASNGVYEAATEAGMKIKVVETDANTLLVTKRKDLKGKQAIRAAMLDNLVADSSSFDYDAEILREIVDSDPLIAQIAKEEEKLKELLGEPITPEFREYDESIADGVEVCKCPTCGHEHAKRN